MARCKSVSKQWLSWLSCKYFLTQKQAKNLTLAGFYYNSTYNTYQGCCLVPPLPPLLPQDDRHGTRRGILAPLNSSNGLVLLYNSYLGKGNSSFIVYDPSHADYITLPIAPSLVEKPDASLRIKRFLVYGFAFDPHSISPNFTVAELSDDGGSIRVNIYSSITNTWTTGNYPAIEPVDSFMLSGPSVFFRGALHWLLEPSGVISYTIRNKKLHEFTSVPGDLAYVDDEGYCNCVRKMMDSGRDGYSQCKCTCRYLGESMDHLIYVRATGDAEFSVWTLDDYYRRIWLQRQIFSYNQIKAELKEICSIQKEYGDDDICSGFILPYEVSTIPPPSGMPRRKAATGTAVEKPRNTYASVNRPENTRILVYCHEGNAELARAITLTHQPELTWTPAYNFLRPFRRYFNVTSTDDHHMNLASSAYNDYVRAEASVYGFLGGRKLSPKFMKRDSCSLSFHMAKVNSSRNILQS
ncbi:F-BOX PROTEIN INTERACTION DOMAIN PROTEIN-RELATED [Salix viminalis]|uniref:F-BOX PROTEIN INTERACTION DOMAIN PROTEIN-RELATED n=1 Tax=Salix viminalis TaxID=40686 RepID=A0A9Q0ZQQ7_SALVM|nr:F-BOX PROTEIN INTERACTION DOMAIN PROTEIN-RELATED [Salix viminalis]